MAIRSKARVAALGLASMTLALCVGPAVAAEVKVVAVQALTGPYAYAGVPGREGIDLALEAIQAKKLAGEHTISLAIEDTGSEKQQTISLVSRFAKDPSILAILGPTTSIEGVAVAPIANEHEIPLVTTTAVADAISKAGKWAFRTPASPAVIVGDIGRVAAKLGVTNAALVFTRDNDGGIAQKNVARKALEDSAVKVGIEEGVLASDTDFTSQVTKLQAANVDAIFFALPAEQSANFIIQARQAGMPANLKILGTPTMGSERFIAIGGSAVEGATFVADYFTENTGAQNADFVAAFKAKYGKLPDAPAALGYTALMVLAEAIKNAGAEPTRDGIRQKLTEIQNLPVVLGLGRFQFTEDRSPAYGTNVVTVRDGRFVLAN